jgi:hypothetical protein
VFYLVDINSIVAEKGLTKAYESFGVPVEDVKVGKKIGTISVILCD